MQNDNSSPGSVLICAVRRLANRTKGVQIRQSLPDAQNCAHPFRCGNPRPHHASLDPKSAKALLHAGMVRLATKAPGALISFGQMMTKMKRQAGHYPRLDPYGVASESTHRERGAIG